MGYALFAQRKVLLNSQLNNAQLEQTQLSNMQLAIATQKLSKSQQLSSLQASQAQELSVYYENLREVSSNPDFKEDHDKYEDARNDVQAAIDDLEQKFQVEVDAINNEIYQISVNENVIENEVKRLDTLVTDLQQQLDAVQDAEGKGIERSIPKYSGIQ